MITVEAHLATILDAVRLVDDTTVPTADALGRTLRAPVHSAVDLPLFDNSAMDGFAVRHTDAAAAASDNPIVLRVVADLPAGTALDPALGPGEAARIMTGSPVPSDADAIVPFEATAGGLEDSLGDVQVLHAPALGAHIRRRGEDITAGAELLPAGVELGPLQLGAIAAAGVDRVVAARRPRVAVVSTGSELAPPGAPLTRGMIPESNGTLLAALVTQAGAEVVLQASVPDVDDELRRILADAAFLGADAVITSGGVSAGAYEVVKSAVSAMAFSKVAMQPGKPQGFGVMRNADPELGGPLLFGLPGNPVSAAVSFEVFVRPALLAMQGRARLQRRILPLPAAAAWRTPPNRRQYLPVVIAEGAVTPATTGGSHMAGGLGGAEAYAIVPAEVESVAVGDIVDVMLVT